MQLLPTIQVLAVETKHKQKKSSIFFPKVRKSVQPTSTVRSKKQKTHLIRQRFFRPIRKQLNQPRCFSHAFTNLISYGSAVNSVPFTDWLIFSHNPIKTRQLFSQPIRSASRNKRMGFRVHNLLLNCWKVSTEGSQLQAFSSPVSVPSSE